MQNQHFIVRRQQRNAAQSRMDELIRQSSQKLRTYLMLSNAGGLGLSASFFSVQMGVTGDPPAILALILTLYALGAWVSLNEHSSELSSFIFYRESEFAESPMLEWARMPNWLSRWGVGRGVLFRRGQALAFNISLMLFIAASVLALGWIWWRVLF